MPEQNAFSWEYLLSIEQRQSIRKQQGGQYQCRYCPKDHLVGRSHLGYGTHFSRLALFHWPINSAPREEHRYQRNADENRAIG